MHRIVTTYAPAEASSLIDVGCATSVFLYEAAKQYYTEGIVLSTWAPDLASSHHRVHRILVSLLKPTDFLMLPLCGTLSRTSIILSWKSRRSISYSTTRVSSSFTPVIVAHFCQDSSVSGGGGTKEYTFSTSPNHR